MKKYKLAAALMACMIASVPFTSRTVRAEGVDYSQTIDSVPIRQYLTLKKDIAVPHIIFHYTLSPGVPISGSENTHEILAGPSGAVFKASQSPSLSVSFSPSDGVTSEENAPSGSTISFATPDNSDEVFAEKPLTLDLSGVTFPAAGIYRYVVTEQSVTEAGIVSDGANKRYIDVFVHKSDQTDDDVFVPGTAIVRLNDGAPDAEGKAEAAIKSTGFTSRYATNRLGFSKVITGNQSSANKYFKFTVKLNGSITEDSGRSLVEVSGEFDLHPSESMATLYDGKDMEEANNVGQYVTLSQLRQGKTFYIKGGQNVQLNGIPAGIAYEVTEEAEDYTPTVEVTGDTDCTVNDGNVADSALTDDTTLAFLNTLDGTIPSTGVTAAFAIPAAAMLTGVAGIILLAAKRIRSKKRKAWEGN